jgi:hypothetical protein
MGRSTYCNLPDTLGNLESRGKLEYLIQMFPRVRKIVNSYINSPTNLDRFL